MPEYKSNTYLETYGKLRNRVRLETGLTLSCIDVSTAIEWDRIRLLINPNAVLSPEQMKVGVIPENWRDY